MQPASRSEATTDTPRVTLRGTCRVTYAFDVGFAIDLDDAQRRAAQESRRDILRHRRRAPRDFQYRPLPLRLVKSAEPVAVGDTETAARVEIVLFDFGAVAISFFVPVDHSSDALARLSDALYDHDGLTDEARRHANDLIDLMDTAISRPSLSTLVEDYVSLEIHELDPPLAPMEWVATNRAAVARILRAEAGELSDQEIDDALAVQIGFGRDELTIIDFSTAIIFDAEPEEIAPLLEFATVQLLELRTLDDSLDDGLDRAFKLLSHERWPWRVLFGGVRRDLRTIALMETDFANAFEASRNALKLLNDQFLARLYRCASTRLHLEDWRQSVREKLDTLEGIYDKISGERQALRLEILEWIIIILITISIILQIMAGGH